MCAKTGQGTDDDTKRRKRFACWDCRHTLRIGMYGNNGLTKAPQSYVYTYFSCLVWLLQRCGCGIRSSEIECRVTG